MIRLIRADNPGPMTLDGTNTWLIPDGPNFVVVDPGPLLESHLLALESATDGRVSRILLTHDHPDHAEGADEFARRVNAQVSAAAFGDHLQDGEVIDVESGRITVLDTPGHTGDSTTFLVELSDQTALLTGDTVLGRGTTVVIPPDGRLSDYLNSLDRLESIATDFNARGIALALLPGHGPTHDDVKPVLDYYITHRQKRLEQIRSALRDGVKDPQAIVDHIYADVPANVRAAALLSVQTQLEFLNERDG